MADKPQGSIKDYWLSLGQSVTSQCHFLDDERVCGSVFTGTLPVIRGRCVRACGYRKSTGKDKWPQLVRSR